MKLLLAGLFALLPLIAHAEDLGTFNANEVDPNFLPNPFGTGDSSDPNSDTNELGPYSNPYSPSSATNFEAIAAPPLSDHERNDQGRLSMSLSNFESISKSFDRYGIPYSSDSIFQRYGVGNPYRSDCSNNPYGQGWQHRVR
jgi:hypothetical protein